MKEMKRAQRRHQFARLKKRRHDHWGRDLRGDARQIGKAAQTPCPCSCFMCGNPRKWWKEKSIQERRHDEIARMTELAYVHVRAT